MLPSFQPERGEVGKSTVISTRIEPLEETPEEAECENFHEPFNLFPENLNTIFISQERLVLQGKLVLTPNYDLAYLANLSPLGV